MGTQRQRITSGAIFSGIPNRPLFPLNRQPGRRDRVDGERADEQICNLLWNCYGEVVREDRHNKHRYEKYVSTTRCMRAPLWEDLATIPANSAIVPAMT